MGILDDVVVNAKSAAEAVGKTAGKIVDVSKLKISAAEVNSEITRRYQALGQYVYENKRDLIAEDVELAGKLSEIDELFAQANMISKELMDKQNKALCSTCGNLSPSSATFCSICGTKLSQDNDEGQSNSEG